MGTLSEPPVNLSQNPRETVIIWWLSFTLETIKQNMSEGVCEAGGCPEGGGGVIGSTTIILGFLCLLKCGAHAGIVCCLGAWIHVWLAPPVLYVCLAACRAVPATV